ncbi:hypothetical protein BpHYR1_010798 [Brachionus plicatilis]|uniref:Uncharacterized protein n=1 Tax=Brachionus plicatilis TaxID=10195 RepID=A0A3M7QWK9_BRAPC|nr:hypothetical protein BpHYR1_010798 [Brachionus plicatilis]
MTFLILSCNISELIHWCRFRNSPCKGLLELKVTKCMVILFTSVVSRISFKNSNTTDHSIQNFLSFLNMIKKTKI